MEYEKRRLSDVLLEVRYTYTGGDSYEFLLSSDWHFDNPKCNRKLLFQHLDRAKEREAGVFCFGDLFCMMQGRFDPRRSKKNVRTEHNKENYLDVVFQDTADLLAPYAGNIIAVSDGNHETGILKNIEINPLAHLCEKLNYKHGGNVEHMGYQGFVKFVFQHASGGQIRNFLLYFFHGKFGGIVTKGVLGVNRHGLAVPQAEAIVTGHSHDRWIVPQPRFWIDSAGNFETKEQYHIKTGTYKEEFAQAGGWAVEKIVMPKNLGGVWMTLKPGRDGVKTNFSLA